MTIDIECPHGWTDCPACKNYDLCKLGLYEPKPIEIAAKICEKKMQDEATRSVELIKKSNAARAYTDLDRFYSWRSPSLHHKEAVLVGGPPAKGGSKSGKSKKSKKGNKPTVYVWGETL